MADINYPPGGARTPRRIFDLGASSTADKFLVELVEDYAFSPPEGPIGAFGVDSMSTDGFYYLNAASCPDCGAGMVRQGLCFACPVCGFGGCGM